MASLFQSPRTCRSMPVCSSNVLGDSTIGYAGLIHTSVMHEDTQQPSMTKRHKEKKVVRSPEFPKEGSREAFNVKRLLRQGREAYTGVFQHTGRSMIDD